MLERAFGVSLKERRRRFDLLGVAPALLLLLACFILPFVEIAQQAFSMPNFSLLAFEKVFSTRSYTSAFLFTFKIATIVTIICAITGYIAAYALVTAGPTISRLLLIAVVLPYFTSALVRTYAWMLLLGTNGTINNILLHLSIISQPIKLMYNETAIIIGMTYVLLPYMTLTLFTALKAIDTRVVQASFSLGASKFATFTRVILPLTLPGLAGGALLVFLLAMGFFVTPALMGGPSNIMIGVLIEQQIEINVDWSLASALSVILLGLTLMIFLFYRKIISLDGLFTAEK